MAMWLMLQQDLADDYVIATNQTHTVRDCVRDRVRRGRRRGLERYVEIDPQFVRPAEVDLLIGDPTKAKRDLGWEPTTNFEELIRLMTRPTSSCSRPELSEGSRRSRASIDRDADLALRHRGARSLKLSI